jgi:hypothetical protein
MKHFYPEIFKKQRLLEFMGVHLQRARVSRQLPKSFTLTVASPADESSLFGWRILVLRSMGRCVSVHVHHAAFDVVQLDWRV